MDVYGSRLRGLKVCRSSGLRSAEVRMKALSFRLAWNVGICIWVRD